MSQLPATREEYLERLEDLLPPRDVARVRQEVEALILDRAAAECDTDPALDQAAAEVRALAALGSPEDLAEELAPTEVRIPLAVRRNYGRLLAAVFACHLLLSIALTVAGSSSAAVPGLLSPLPKGPFGALFLGVLSIFLIDAGGMLLVFWAIGRVRPERPLPMFAAVSRWTRRGAFEGLVLLGLLALLCNAYVDEVFAVKQDGTLQTFLAADLRHIIPWLNVVFGCFALRHVLTLAGRATSPWSLAADALGALAGSAWLVLAATRSELVQMPVGSQLTREAAEVLDGLIERVFLLVLVVGALILMVRFVRQAIRFSHRIRS